MLPSQVGQLDSTELSAARAARRWVCLIEALGVFALIMLYVWWVRLDRPRFWTPILGLIFGTHYLHGEGLGRLGFR